MLSKSWKWELDFVHYIAKFTISMFVISRFECNHGSWYLTFIWRKKWWINNPHALALRGNCFDDFLKILFEYGYDSYFCQVLIQKSRLPLTYTSWYHNIFYCLLIMDVVLFIHIVFMYHYTYKEAFVVKSLNKNI